MIEIKQTKINAIKFTILAVKNTLLLSINNIIFNILINILLINSFFYNL